MASQIMVEAPLETGIVTMAASTTMTAKFTSTLATIEIATTAEVG